MMQTFNPFLRATTPPPVMEARRWIAETPLPAGQTLLNFSQAAPGEAPPEPLREAMAGFLRETDTHLYGPVLGLPALREEIAVRWSAAYQGTINPDDVAITPGCNLAFCTALSVLAAPGDAVMVTTPWYFNHHMWLTQTGIDIVPVPCGPGMMPDLEAARARIGPRIKAIVLVTPNNPTGAEYPSNLIASFAALARENGVALVLDETYRDFASQPGPAHDLFTDPDWRDTLVHLYSFSKAYRLTGHRVGAIIASPKLLSEAEKVLDTVAICAPQLGQKAALWGLRHLGNWLAGERDEILRRRDAVIAGMDRLPGWNLLGCGAYFAWAEHPFECASDVLARHLLASAGVLLLPGTMFGPTRARGGDGAAERQLRIAFANASPAGTAELIDRLGTCPAPALVSQGATA